MGRLAASIALCLVGACSDAGHGPLPPIADKLPSNVRQAEPEFDRRVKAAFPIGIPEGDMILKLQGDGFKISPPGPDGYRSGDIKRGDFICQTIWSVRWRADAGILREVFGVYGHRCP